MIKIVIRWVMVLVVCWVTIAQSNNIKNKEKPTAVTLHSYDWNGEIPEKSAVVVRNMFGDIRSRNHGEKKIFLHAVYQKIGVNAIEPNFVINKKNGRWYIDVVYNEKIFDKDGNLRGRVDLAVLFPESVSINASTDSGMIKVDRSGSDVVANSGSGEIKLKTTGLFSVNSDSGDISLTLRGVNEVGVSSANTNSGNILATFFSDMNITVSAQTNGKMIKNGKLVNKKHKVYSHGKKINAVNLISKKGDIDFSFINPPDLIKSVVPITVTQDLRDLPKAKSWQAGDPVVDRDDKIDHSSNNPNNKKSN